MNDHIPEILALTNTLEEDGILTLPPLIGDSEFSAMQKCFDIELKHPRWNTCSGYQQNEKWRLLVEDVLVLDPAFLTFALHPFAREILGRYIGENYVLSEARGWETIATKREFHGWHNDAWYDLERVRQIPRELKIGLYLTDVETGYFEYVKGSHKLIGAPRHWSNKEVDKLSLDVVRIKGKAGHAFMFDTAGIHRQSSPVVTPRRALLYTYHDSKVPIQDMDRKFGRYHSLLLRAAFIGNLSLEEQRILGIGNSDYFYRFQQPQHRYPFIHKMFQIVMKLRLGWQDIEKVVKDIVDAIMRRIK